MLDINLPRQLGPALSLQAATGQFPYVFLTLGKSKQPILVTCSNV
jgi:hypothetical protein